MVAKEVKLVAFQKGIRIHQYLDDWLVRASTHHTCLQHTQILVTLCQELGWLVNKGKSELVPKQVFNFVGYQFDLKEGKVRPTEERWQALTHKIRSILSDPHCPVRQFMSLIGRSPLRATPHETHTVALEKQLEGPRVTGKGDPGPQIPPPPSKVVAGGKQCASRSTITPSKTCSANLYRRIKRRVGRLLRRAHCKGTVVPTREQVTHKPLGAESSFLALKEFQTLVFNKTVLVATDNTTVVAYINKEGGMKSDSVCPTVENSVLVHQSASNPQGTSHPRPAERDSRQAIQAWPDHSNRVVTSSRSVPSCMFKVASATSGPVCHQVQQQTTTVCITGTRPPGLGSGCTQPLLGGPGPIRLPTGSHLGQVVEKLQDYPCNRIILIAPGWPNMPWFWDLVAMSSQIPLCLPSIPNLVSQPFNQVLHRNLSNLNLHAWLLEPQQSRSKVSLRQWQHELRLLKEDQPDLSMRQSGPFLPVVPQ